MKPMFYILLAFTAVLAVTAKLFDPVLDSDGDIISNGSYYVLPRVPTPAGGGLVAHSIYPIQCPFYISQESSDILRGDPVRFSDWRARLGFVPESVDLNIQMVVDYVDRCYNTTYWHLASFPPGQETEKLFVASGPKPNGSFRIIKTEDARGGYKIVFCFKNGECKDIGIVGDDYVSSRLALSSTPFEVRFVKATKTETSSKDMSII